MDIRIQRSEAIAPAPPADALGFGVHFSPHMFRARLEAGRGFFDAAIGPRGAIALDPAAAVLHYGQAVFEGLKAFRGSDGLVRLFRVEAHARRFEESARRICLPVVPAADFLAAVRAFTDVEREAIPTAPDTSLYVRPTLVGTEAFLGVRPSAVAEFFIIGSPVGSYWQGQRRGLRISVETELVRAAPGGGGAAKFAGNYAVSLLASERAKARGFDQVLWLDAKSHAEIEEIGTMNVFVRIGDTVVTPPLGGTILPGITRDSVITLLRTWGVAVEERVVRLDEIEAASAGGTLREMFGTGTGGVIAPIGTLGLREKEITVGTGGEGELSRKLYDAIRAIQYGRAEDRYGWLTEVLPVVGS
jgi:branched-chain amino acid aminotransferase